MIEGGQKSTKIYKQNVSEEYFSLDFRKIYVQNTPEQYFSLDFRKIYGSSDISSDTAVV